MDITECEATNHTVQEIVAMLRENEAVLFSSARSRVRLAEWLDELVKGRDAIENARVALAGHPNTRVVFGSEP